MTPYNALRHLIYFEKLAETEENSHAWIRITGGLVVLRMLDTWYDLGPVSLRENRRGIANVRIAVEQIEESSPLRNILLEIFEAVQRARHPDVSTILPGLIAYGAALHSDRAWELASDAYITVLDYVGEDDSPEMRVDAFMQIGNCERMMGNWDEAAFAYAEAGMIASQAGDIERVLRARVGDAKLAMDRGNLAAAELLLADTIQSASANESLAEVAVLAMQERAAIAVMRGDDARP